MPFIDELLEFKNEVFLGTGTHHGNTIFKIANSEKCEFSKIISLELSDVFFDMCKKRFENNDKIQLYKANSKCDLYDIIKDINTPITFWLDSHWSGCDNVGCDSEIICPIIYELEQIRHHSINTHTIMIDDIRLMNNSSDRYSGFPVTLMEILNKIFEINPNYIIKYFDDEITKNDVLVAYIEKNEDKICFHKYLTHCVSNDLPPGLADFLRGTIALYYFSKRYNYKLLLDSNHMLFNYLKPNKNFTSNNPFDTTIEVIPPPSYESIYYQLINLFQSQKSFSVLTNSFYNDFNTGKLINFGKISDECRNYMLDILQPSDEIINKINNIFENVYGINQNDYFEIIHLRCGDNHFYNDCIPNNYLSYYNKINNLVNDNPNKNFILICDSSEISNKLKQDIPRLLYWNNKKIHLGNILQFKTDDTIDTIVDFFIMTKSKKIYAYSESGFSKIINVIYNIEYNIFG